MLNNEWEAARWVASHLPNPLAKRPDTWMRFTDRWRPVDEGEVISVVAQTIDRRVAEIDARIRETDDKDYLQSERKKLQSYLGAQRLRNLMFLMASVMRDDREWDVLHHSWPAADCLVDLAVGSTEAHRPEKLLSKYSGVKYDGRARAPRWAAFLREIQSNDDEMIDYLQRAVGYSMTGLINEQVLFILYGSGANGKNLFLEVLYELFGQLGYQTSFRVLERASGGETSPGAASPHLAAFQGKRFIMASESVEGSSFNDGLVKSLTGDGQITARNLFERESVFRNTGKFWLACNNMPRVSDVTPGFWRRLHIVPFLASFSGDSRDLFLKDKLLAELPGVLNWALAGARRWYEIGLRPPRAVANAVSQYRGVSDPIGGFLEDCCRIHASVWAPKVGLYTAYKEYATGDATVRPISRDRFYSIVRNHGFEEARVDNTRVFKGLCLRRDVPKFPVTQEELAASAAA